MSPNRCPASVMAFGIFRGQPTQPATAVLDATMGPSIAFSSTSPDEPFIKEFYVYLQGGSALCLYAHWNRMCEETRTILCDTVRTCGAVPRSPVAKDLCDEPNLVDRR